MTIALSPAANTARLNALLAYMDTGAGVARARIYSTAKPTNTATAPASAPLVELPLLKPSGSVSAGVLTLAPGAAALNTSTGTALSCRIVNANGDTVLDCDVGAANSIAEVWITGGGAAGLTLFEGGQTTLASAVFG